MDTSNSSDHEDDLPWAMRNHAWLHAAGFATASIAIGLVTRRGVEESTNEMVLLLAISCVLWWLAALGRKVEATTNLATTLSHLAVLERRLNEIEEKIDRIQALPPASAEHDGG